MLNSENVEQIVERQFEQAMIETVSSVRIEYVSGDFSAYDEVIEAINGITFVPLFTAETLDVRPDGTVDWHKKYTQQHWASVMHLYSLDPVGRLLRTYEKNKDENKLFLARIVLRDFFKFCKDPVQLEIVKSCPSGDHSTATRVKVLVKYINILSEETPKDADLLRDVVFWLFYWSNWLSDPVNYRENNHGLMGSLALLHAGIQFKNIKSISENFISISCVRTQRLIENSFDSDGLCNENTIEYHNFNIYLYATFVEFLRGNSVVSSHADEIESHLSKARHALRLCIRQDGTIPPIGDSTVYKANCDSINKSFCFRESGFAVIKNDDLYLSLICGSRTEIHKQVDDTSITLRYKGCDLIVDGGSYLYDRLDRHRICLESSRGHSGIFLDQFDGLIRSDFVKSVAPFNGKIFNFIENINDTELECLLSLCSGCYTLRRKIKVVFPDEIIIQDHITGPGVAAETVAVQRFLLAPGVDCKVFTDNVWRINGGEITATLFQLSCCRADHYHGEDGEVVRGWYSTEYKKILPVEGVDFIQTGGTSVDYLTIIKLAEVASLQELSPAANKFINELRSFRCSSS